MPNQTILGKRQLAAALVAVGAVGAGGDGNTSIPPATKKKRVSPSYHWCFTLKHSCGTIGSIGAALSPLADILIFQHEVGNGKDGDQKLGYHHWQGYVKFKIKKRPQGLLDLVCHWEKTRNIEASKIYACKEETFVDDRYLQGYKKPRPLQKVTYDMLRQWQKRIADDYKEPAGQFDRKINWYWEGTGNIGKSVLCKYFIDQRGAIMIAGKGVDILYAIKAYVDTNGEGPEIIIMDIARCVGHISHNAIEQAKNGCFFSGKYEGGMVRVNTPHIICFSNQSPDYSSMSMDRWNVVELRV